MKKGLSILIALTMVLAMASTAFAATVSIDAAFDEHDFVAYQIFKGVQAHETDTPDNAPLGELKWGSGIKADDFLEALQAEASIFNNGKASTDTDYVANVFSAITYDATKADESAKLVAEAMGTFASNSAAAEKIAKLALANKKGNGTELEEGDNTLDDGYYLIIDTTDVSGEYDYNNPALLQVTEELTIAPKTNKPSVDKQVLDETADAETGHTNGWGETADHAINETFQFKLTAKLPATTKFERYDT